MGKKEPESRTGKQISFPYPPPSSFSLQISNIPAKKGKKILATRASSNLKGSERERNTSVI